MPITLYGYPSSPACRSVLLTAKAIGVDIEEKEVNLQKQENRTEAFLKMNPTHTIPTMDDNGFYLWESRAIMAYLVQQYGKDDHLYPKEPKKRAVVDNMLFFDADSLISSFGQYFVAILHENASEVPAMKALMIERLGFLNTILGQRPYAAGDHLTIADFCLIGSLSVIETTGIDLGDFPHVQKWSTKVKAEVPFYDEVSKKGVELMNKYLIEKLKI